MTRSMTLAILTMIAVSSGGCAPEVGQGQAGDSDGVSALPQAGPPGGTAILVSAPIVVTPLAAPIRLAPAPASGRTAEEEGVGPIVPGRHGTFGVGIVPLDAAGLSAQSLVPGHGLMVAIVLPGSAAANAGIEVGDILVSLDGEPLIGRGDIQRVIASRPDGAIVAIHLIRKGAAFDLAAEL
jgi:S1-C subfamily serine protease